MTLREEALQIVNDMPEYLLKALLYNLEDFKDRQFDVIDNEKVTNGEYDIKKVAAFAAMEELRYHNRDILSKIDPEEERETAMEEKYGPFN